MRVGLRRLCLAELRIHRHGFLGSPDIVDEGLSACRSGHSGLNLEVIYCQGAGALLKGLVIHSITNDCLLIEADAPCLLVCPPLCGARQHIYLRSHAGGGVVLSEMVVNWRDLYCL